MIYCCSTLVPFRWHGGKYMCFFCSEHYIHASQLREHVENHTDVDLDVIFKGALIGYETRVKMDISQISCTDCCTEFSSVQDFIGHLNEDHGQSFDGDILNRFEVFQLSDDEMACLDCDETFRHFFQLLKHTHKEHADVEKHHKYLCEICGKGFAEKGSVQTHINQTHCVQQCKYCPETFETCYALDKHVVNMHAVEKCQCQICFEIFPNRYRRRRHLAFVHDFEDAQLKCDECGKIFTRNNRLMMHKRRVHLRVKDVSCEECGMQFFDLEALGKHKVRHVDRQFKCSLCQRTFKRKRMLVIHVASSHCGDAEAN